jgi:hypothetical protein
MVIEVGADIEIGFDGDEGMRVRVKAEVDAYAEKSDANPDDVNHHLVPISQIRTADGESTRKMVAQAVRDELVKEGDREVLTRRTAAAKKTGVCRKPLVRAGTPEVTFTKPKSTVKFPDKCQDPHSPDELAKPWFSVEMLEGLVGRLLNATAEAKKLSDKAEGEDGGLDKTDIQVELPIRELGYLDLVALTGEEELPESSHMLIGMDQSDLPEVVRIPAKGTLIVKDLSNPELYGGENFSIDLGTIINTENLEREYVTLFELLMDAAINKGCIIELEQSLIDLHSGRPPKCFVRQMKLTDDL